MRASHAGPGPVYYDYDLQVWVRRGHVVPCGHPATMHPHCCNGHKYGLLWIEEARRLEGLPAVPVASWVPGTTAGATA